MEEWITKPRKLLTMLLPKSTIEATLRKHFSTISAEKINQAAKAIADLDPDWEEISIRKAVCGHVRFEPSIRPGDAIKVLRKGR